MGREFKASLDYMVRMALKRGVKGEREGTGGGEEGEKEKLSL